MLQVPGATSFMGGIGNDKFGEEMKKSSKLAGVNVGLITHLLLSLSRASLYWLRYDLIFHSPGSLS